MRRSVLAVVLLGASFASAQRAWAQPVQRLEVGAQFTTLHLSGIGATDSGIGGRFAWHVSEALALESVSDFFPTGKNNVRRGGRKYHVLFGPKVGWRAARVGVFAKARAGAQRVGEGRQVGACILIFPPPEGCYAGETRLAFDAGAVVEVYPSPRSSLRVEVGDIATRLGRSSSRFARRGDFAHDLQVTVGVGFRFGGRPVPSHAAVIDILRVESACPP
jgi:hypothetical protein